MFCMAMTFNEHHNTPLQPADHPLRQCLPLLLILPAQASLNERDATPTLLCCHPVNLLKSVHLRPIRYRYNITLRSPDF